MIFHIENKLHFSGLLLLAAFLKHSGNPYKWSVVQTEGWPVLSDCTVCGLELNFRYLLFIHKSATLFGFEE